MQWVHLVARSEQLIGLLIHHKHIELCSFRVRVTLTKDCSGKSARVCISGRSSLVYLIQYLLIHQRAESTHETQV